MRILLAAAVAIGLPCAPAMSQSGSIESRLADVYRTVAAEQSELLTCAALGTPASAEMRNQLDRETRTARRAIITAGLPADTADSLSVTLEPERLVRRFPDEASLRQYCANHADGPDRFHAGRYTLLSEAVARILVTMPPYQARVEQRNARRGRLDAVFDKAIAERTVMLTCSATEPPEAAALVRRSWLLDLLDAKAAMEHAGLPADEISSTMERAAPDQITRHFDTSAQLDQYCQQHAGWQDRWARMQITYLPHEVQRALR